MKKRLTEHAFCMSRLNCRVCRDTGESGRGQRKLWENIFELPSARVTVNGVELFECPFGVTSESIPPYQVPPGPPTLHHPGPGSLLEAMIEGMGIEEVKDCGCAGRKAQMDLWWLEQHGDAPMTVMKLAAYIKRYGPQVRSWLTEEAAKRGITPTPAMLARGLAAGFRHYRKGNP